MQLFKLVISLIIISSFSSISHAQTFTSSQQQVNLIELYTSEGCSSCPPADRWLSALRQDPQLWSHFIPIAFHVDYWDYIGWKDRFADRRFGQRHYRYAQDKQISSVYTPAFVFNGQEWRRRPWSNVAKQQSTNAGQLTSELSQGKLNSHFQSQLAQNQTLVLNIALLSFDIKSEITAGENQGDTLSHDFVVVGYRTVAMQPTNKGFVANNITLPQAMQHTSPRAIVTWVNTEQTLNPIQATGGWLKQMEGPN